jgi:hypothetical protein
MTSALLLFACTFVVVFALGLQSLNVNGGHHLAATLTSVAISASSIWLYKAMPGADGSRSAPTSSARSPASTRACGSTRASRLDRRRRPPQPRRTSRRLALRRSPRRALMARAYETLGRRFLAILEVGGPRKPNVLRALARHERHFKSTIRRLVKAGLIVYRRQHGGLYALVKQGAEK